MIYIHIPFCKQACHYCDFHFSTNLKQKQAFLYALDKEIELQKDFFSTAVFPSSPLLVSPRATNPQKLKTIYFGGGTPSILEISELKTILEKIKSTFLVDENAEITLEANPDDLTSLEFLQQLKEIGFNRLSIGIQSFEESFLKFMNRAHNADEAKNCVKLAQKAGFENISIDLIYGVQLPKNEIYNRINVNNFENQSEKITQNPVSNPHYFWQKDLEFALSLNIPHISAYCLTIEPKTQFGNSLKKGKIKPIDEEFAAQQFEILVETLKQNNYIHYEISNFAKPNQFSKHNTAYWQDQPYLGLGASAHSYDGKNRFMNAANNRNYVESLSKDNLSKNNLPQTIDELTENDRINEYFLTSLRTIWGIDLEHLLQKYKYNLLENQSKIISKLIDNQMIELNKGKIILTEKGKLFADGIASDLFV